jgi:hypothetical protein
MRAWLRGHRVEALAVAVSGGPLSAVAQDQEPSGAGGEARGRRGVAIKWPAAFLIIALIVNALWIATLGCALARLI